MKALSRLFFTIERIMLRLYKKDVLFHFSWGLGIIIGALGWEGSGLLPFAGRIMVN